MSGDLKRFEEALGQDREIQEQFKAAVKRLIEESKDLNVKSEAEIMSKAAAELGFDVSITDFEKQTAETEELDDEALERVAGGGEICPSNVAWGCWTDYRCDEFWVTNNKCLLSSLYFNE